jgi:RNA polymerase primary sigma factor
MHLDTSKREHDPKLRIKKSSDSLETYLDDIKKTRFLTLQEECDLGTRIQKGDKSAVNTLVEANLKFVVAVCRNYRHQGLSMGDLINEGNLGLIRAAHRFDASLNLRFISYAVWWIRQNILAALADQARILRISPVKVGVIQKIGKANQRLEQKLGRSPRMDEVAEELGLSELEIAECLQLSSPPLSISRPSVDDGADPLEERLEDKEAVRSDKDALLSLLGKNMAKVLATLDEQEENVIRLYYGIGREAAMSLDEIAVRYGVSGERIRQIKTKALERLRHPSRKERLDPFQE